jgi:hypothetical protein
MLVLLLFVFGSSSRSQVRVPPLVTPQTPSTGVNVTVLVEGGEVVPTFTLTFTHQAGTRAFPVLMDIGFGNPFYVLSVSEADRVLNLPLPEGDCRVGWTGLPENYSVQSIVAGPVDLRRSLLSVKRDATPRVVVTLKVEKLRGRFVRGNVNGLTPQGLSARPPVALLGGQQLISTRTKTDGSFEFADVPPGSYVARVARTLGVQPSPDVPVVVSGKDVSGLQIQMPPVKSVRGRIVVEGAGPLRQAIFQVTVGTPPRTNTGPIGVGTDGSFRILLPEGTCRIALLTATLPVGYTLRSLTYGPTDLLANPSVRISSETDAELRAVVAVTNVTATIRLPDSNEIVAQQDASNAWVRVRGRVNGEVPNPRVVLFMNSEQIRVVAKGTGGLTLTGVGASNLTAPMNFDGSFEFPKVTQGRYLLSAGTPGFAVYRTIEVGNSEIDDVEISMPSTKSVRGQLSVEGGGLLPRGYGFTLTSRDGSGVMVMLTPGCNGAFRAGLPEGEYRVSTALPAGYVSAFTYGSTNLLRDSLKVSPNDDAELRITFAATSTVGTSVIGGNFFGGTNFSGLENGMPWPLPSLLPPPPPGLARQTATSPTESVVNGCVYVAGGGAAEFNDLDLRFLGKSGVNIPVMPDGSFRASLPKGEGFKFIGLSALPPGYRMRSIKLGTADLVREGFTLDDDQGFIFVVLEPR